MSAPNQPTPTTQQISDVLRKNIPDLKECDVKDVSGGCGSFFSVTVVSSAFKGLPLLKQHRMVTDALKKEIPMLHGLTINTRTP